MKKINTLFIIFALILVNSCRKDEVVIINNPNSKGNVMLLKVSKSNTFEGGLEFDLQDFNSPKADLPIIFTTYSLYDKNGFFIAYGAEEDTLLHSLNSEIKIPKKLWSTESFKADSTKITYNEEIFQFLVSDNIDVESAWSLISNLELVLYYRRLNPKSKIAVLETIENEYDEELSIFIPYKALYFFLAK